MHQRCVAGNIHYCIENSDEEEKEMSLKELRARTGLSQSKFAEKAGLSVRSYQNYEQEHRNIYEADINTLLRICRAAECDLSEFITDEECKAIYRELRD